MSTPPAVDTIERFAELSALLADPFAHEHEILQAAGLDAARWRALEAHWRGLMQGDRGAELAARYGTVYRETKERLMGGPGSTLPDARGFLSSEPQPWRAEAARVGLGPGEPPPTWPTGTRPAPHDIAETLDSPGPLPLPALPFQPRADAGPGGTLDLPARLVPGPALPFERR